MLPPTSLILGPGPYGEQMIQALLDAGALSEVVRYFPHFRLDRAVYCGDAPPSLRTALDLRLHGAAVRLAWSAWRRLPVLGRRETPRGPLFALVDTLAARCLGSRRDASPFGGKAGSLARQHLLVGWSQVSLRSLRRARDAGDATLLEHPTSHIDAWLTSVRAECARLGVRAAYSLLPELLCRRMREECDAAEHICVLSTYARRTMLAAGVPAGKLLQVPLGVDPDLFSPAPLRAPKHSIPGDPDRFSPGPHGAPPRPFRILYVGRLELLKGVPRLLEAFAGLAGDLPGAELWLAGRVLPEIGPFLDALRRRLPDPARLRVLGPLPHEALPDLYRQADVLAFPSLNDAFGLVLLEAMSSGLPVIATPHSAGPDLIDEGRDGHLVPVGDAEALRDRLVALARDPDRRRAMGARARQKVLAAYTWDHYRRRLLAACAAALAPSAGPPPPAPRHPPSPERVPPEGRGEASSPAPRSGPLPPRPKHVS